MFQQLTEDPEAVAPGEEAQYPLELLGREGEDSHPIISHKDPKCQIKDCL